MQTERIQIVLDNDIEPILQGELVLSSDGSPWSGFLLESHRIPGKGRITGFHPVHHLVALCVAGHGTAQIRDGVTHHTLDLEPGTISIFTDDCELQSVLWSGAHEVLLVEICGSRLAQWMAHKNDNLELDLAPQFGIRDPQIAALMCNMRAEIEAGCPTGSLYAESLSRALAAYLSGRYSAIRHKTNDLNLKLSPSQFRRVQDYIHAHLSDDLSVSDLACVVELSPHHFSYLFRNTVGITPHRYVLSKRINEARKLLIARRKSILEVAIILGFASQSHFTDVFRRVTGTTPRHFQQGH